MELTFLVPFHDNWTAAWLLLFSLDRICEENGFAGRVTLVDDGSTEPMPPDFERIGFRHLESVQILHLRRKLGIDRAIAIGLVDCAMAGSGRDVLVIPGDREQLPEDVLRILEAAPKSDEEIVVMDRCLRPTSLPKRLGLAAITFVRSILVGCSIPACHVSLVPFALLKKLVFVPEIWTHYRAALQHSCLPLRTIKVGSVSPIAMDSRCGFWRSALEELGALPVYANLAAFRAGLVLGTVWAIVVLPAVVRVFQAGGSLVASLLFLTFVQMLVILLLALALVSVSRANHQFLPLRDCPQYVIGRTLLISRASVEPLALALEAAIVP